MVGRVERVFIATSAGAVMQSVHAVVAKAGVGLQGDRYHGERGSWSKSKRPVIRQVSLIELGALERANANEAESFLLEDTRRNIVVSNFPLNDLVGRHFFVGPVRMLGVELCEPCERPSRLVGKPKFAERFAGRGGLRAQILTTGLIAVGDLARIDAS